MKAHIVEGVDNLNEFLKGYKSSEVVNICCYGCTYTVVTAKMIKKPIYGFFPKEKNLFGRWEIDKNHPYKTYAEAEAHFSNYPSRYGFGFEIGIEKAVIGFEEVEEGFEMNEKTATDERRNPV